MTRKNLWRELIVDNLQCMRDYIVLLSQGSERRKDSIVDIFEKQNSIEWINYSRCFAFLVLDSSLLGAVLLLIMLLW